MHQFYCYCKGEVTASIFKPTDPCEEQLADCCKAAASCEKMQAIADDRDCSDCQSKYVKLDVDYLLFSADFKLAVPQVLAVAKCFSKKEIEVRKTVIVWENDLPPPPYGKSLLPHLQSFLC